MLIQYFSQVALALTIIIIRSNAQPERASHDMTKVYNDTIDTFSTKIIWRSENLFLLRSRNSPSSRAIGKNDSVENELDDIEERLQFRYATNADILQSCDNLHIFLCYRENCKLIRGKCDSPKDYKNVTFSTSFPNGWAEFSDLFKVMIDNPVDNPFTWCSVLGSILTLGGLLILCFLIWAIVRCIMNAAFRKQAEKAEIRRLLGRKLTVALPNGRKILITNFEIETCDECSRINLIPSNPSDNEIEASASSDTDEGQRISPGSDNMYCFPEGSSNSNQDVFAWDDDGKSLIDRVEPADEDLDNCSTKCYLNDGFSCSSEAIKDEVMASRESLEELSCSDSSSSVDLSGVQARPSPDERKLITPRKMWKSGTMRKLTVQVDVEKGIQESAF